MLAFGKGREHIAHVHGWGAVSRQGVNVRQLAQVSILKWIASALWRGWFSLLAMAGALLIGCVARSPKNPKRIPSMSDDATSPDTPPRPKRGRPSSGVPRKEQIRRAVEKHRRKARYGEGALLQVELPVYLLMEIKAIARREKKSVREVVTRFLAQGWKADYLAHHPKANLPSLPNIREEAADAMIAQWQRDFAASFRRK